MLNLKTAAFGAVSLLILSGSVALAQRPPVDDNRLKNDPAPKVAPKTQAGMSIDDVGATLKSLGYQFKTVTRQPNNFVVHELDINAKGKFVPMDISLSKDGTKLWLTVFLTQLPSGEQIPADIMRKMLEATAAIGPNHFMVTKTGALFLQCPIDNTGITPEALRRNIDLLATDCADLESLWNRNMWGTQVGGGKVGAGK